MGLNVLITNIHLWNRSGTTLYVRDLALELCRQGHRAAVFTLEKGVISSELEAAGIPVVTNLKRLDFAPDIIHGHHNITTRLALAHYPQTPAIYLCHAHVSNHEITPLSPQIRRFFGVSQGCVERLVREGVPREEARLIFNFVDTNRFQPRPPLPARPARALVFSNYARPNTHLTAVQEACRQAGIPLDVAGAGMGAVVDRPEELLGRYDLVFAKAKAALEAMAVGAAVILCDFGGVGPFVTAADFERLRPLNFGFQALTEPLESRHVLAQIDRYDPGESARVRDLVRAHSGLMPSVAGLVKIYREVIGEHAAAPVAVRRPDRRPRIAEQRLYIKLYRKWARLDPDQRDWLKSQRIFQFLAGILRKRIGGQKSQPNAGEGDKNEAVDGA